MNSVGEVIESKQSRCVGKFSGPLIPSVGDWVDVNGIHGIVERYYYSSTNELLGDICYVRQELSWKAPLPPGSIISSCNLKKEIFNEGKIFGGLISSSKDPLPFELDLKYLLGPEGAHINVSGISGLATKTSYLMTVLWAVMKKAKTTKLPVTAFVINMKWRDLMSIHEPSIIGAWEKDHFSDLGLDSTPFENVKYFASHGSPYHDRFDVTSFGYTIENGFESLKNLVWDLDDKFKTIQALVDSLKQGKEREPEEFGYYHSWKSLWTEPPLVTDGYKPNSWSHYALSTTRRFVRHVQNVLDHQNSGLFVHQKNENLITIKDIVDNAKAGETNVIDFCHMNTTEQFFCMNELIQNIYKDIQSPNRILPKHVVIFVDELNRYAPRTADAHPIRNILLEIAERGRSQGISLFSAQQFASHVHSRIVGNATTKVVGRLSSDELSKPEYRFLGKNHKDWLAGMPKGHLIIDHAPFGQPVKISFPRPVFRIG